jgi:hypothetical protein
LTQLSELQLRHLHAAQGRGQVLPKLFSIVVQLLQGPVHDYRTILTLDRVCLLISFASNRSQKKRKEKEKKKKYISPLFIKNKKIHRLILVLESNCKIYLSSEEEMIFDTTCYVVPIFRGLS